VVTSYFSFRTPRDRAAGAALLENLWLYVSNGRSGLRAEHLAFGPAAPGSTTAELELRNATDGDLALRAQVQVEAEGAAPTSAGVVEVTLAAQQAARLSLPYLVATRGKVSLRAIVEDAAGKRLLDWPKTLDIPPAVTLSLKRKHLYPRQERLEGNAQLAPPAGTPPEEVLVAWTIDDRPQSATPAAANAAPLSLPVAGLEMGRHTVTATLRVGQETVGEASTEFFRHGTPRWEVREDGVTLLEGKPFFPFGFYHVSQSFDAAHRSRMAQDLSAAGFNCCHARAMTVAEYAPFLDECAKLGVYVVTEFSAPMYETVERYKTHPAVLAWNPCDEPELNGLAPDEFYARYDRFKQVAPDHLVYAVIASPAEYHAYAGGTDVLAPDVYPVPFAPITTVYRQLRQASAEAAKYDTMLWGVLQCFGGYGGWTRPPTPQELRAMTYLALLAGVKGILYYTYGDQGWVVTDHPEQWEAAKALVPEIKRLAPALLDGRFTLLSEGENDLYAGAWEYQGRTVTVVVNTGTEARTFEGLGTIEAGETVVSEG
jgi:hypothetical protein